MADRTYTTAAFAALAGVTPRALRHYDRLGLLRPRRTAAGYRVYSARDLQTLEEIVALKFIGVPLKSIAAVRRRASGSFAQVLSAQRAALEARRRTLTRAIGAVAAAEAAVRSGTPIDAELFRRINEVMHMDARQEEALAAYTAMLRAKVSHLAGLPAEQRVALRQEWSALVAEVKDALHDDPAGAPAQALLDRWLALLGALTGRDSTLGAALESDVMRRAPEFADHIWARREEWLPPDAARDTSGIAANEALAAIRERARSFAGADVLEFINRARAARR